MSESSTHNQPAPARLAPAAAAEETPVLDVNDDFHSDDTASIDERLAVNYPVEYGRRYHAFRPGSYKFPNDESEMDRLDLAHAMMVQAIGSRLYLAPVDMDKAHNVLDIGTGTGIWAVEMGDIYPGAQILGLDLSAIQPKWIPSNVKFEIDDVESSWVGHTQYDFIMCRYMGASIKDWPKLMDNIYDHLAPGGWAEFQDVNTTFYSQDGSYSDATATAQWMTAFNNACAAAGRDPSVGPKLADWVIDAGFQNVAHHKLLAPLGPWPKDPRYKELGMMNLTLTLNGLEALSLKLFAKMLGRSQAETEVQLVNVRNELKSAAFHAVFDIHVVYGQKLLET
ncbi:Secondary metabolism regulator LAE1 [Colletotrichum spinosum]|uniref:Secondary metabolism regulator LAE1 n=1 Tax=Colletotrichum spinosum TaxID=1347390 RepID=A0A4R8PVK5_9PEZI|nr:Secondary metabolism regulator LAE1 [Colletotrichum spinosum]